MSARKLAGAALVTLALLQPATLALPGQAAEVADYDPERLERHILARGLDRPLCLAVAPDGRVLFIELAGRLACYEPESASTRTLAQLDVFADQENGLLGIALDPNFQENRWIYLLYSPVDYAGQHLSRFTLGEQGLQLESERVLLAFLEQRRECCHHAGALEFGPDGSLYIATGDNTHPGGDSEGFAPLDERPDREPYDAQKGPANTQSLSGKILRIRPTPEGGYLIPPGNLFVAPDLGRPEIYVMGCRNPWRIAVDPYTGALFWGDVGPDAGADGPRGPCGYDEMNWARSAGNFGWPYFIADNQPYRDVDFATATIGPGFDPLRPENRSPNNSGARILPPAQPAWLYYPYGASSRFPALNGDGGRTACAGAVYRFDPALDSPRKWPKSFDAHVFLFDWSRHWIKAVLPDADNPPGTIRDILPQMEFRRPVDLCFGPDGALYLLEYGTTWGSNADAQLVRTDYVSGNRTPHARIRVENNVGPVPLTAHFSAEESFDRDAGDALAYAWRVLPAREVLSRERELRLPVHGPGIHQVELTVTDSAGASASAVVPVLAGNSAPAIWIDTPRDGGFLPPGDVFHYSVYAEDEEDGTTEENPLEFMPRLVVSARFFAGPVPRTDGTTGDEFLDAGLKLMQKSDCFHCHSIDKQIVGPAFRDVSLRFLADPAARAAAPQHILAGSSGLWGEHPMLPHPQHSLEQARTMVEWIARLSEQSTLPALAQALSGSFSVPVPSGSVLLEASYTDRGAGKAPALSAQTSILLRTARVEAEHCSERAGPSVLASASASGGQFVGAIDHGHCLRFERVDLSGIARVRASISSAGSGGAVLLRQDSSSGPLLARFDITPNGAWEDWYVLERELAPSSGRIDLFVCFENSEQRSALLNLDWLEFLSPPVNDER